MPTVLFADDGSLEADRAWLWVTQQATWARWSVETITCQRAHPAGPERPWVIEHTGQSRRYQRHSDANP